MAAGTRTLRAAPDGFGAALLAMTPAGRIYPPAIGKRKERIYGFFDPKF
jgi:hypothetical protein